MHDITIVLRGRKKKGSVAEVALLYYRTFSSSSLSAITFQIKNIYMIFQNSSYCNFVSVDLIEIKHGCVTNLTMLLSFTR